MRAIRWLPRLLLPLLSLPSLADAQCVGFTDVAGVPFSNPTCQNVAWMKNRAITLGCTPTLYCPFDNVNRLQMAAFMNRVGNVLSPDVQSVEETGGTLNLGTTSVICQTPNLPALAPAPGYPRTVDVSASMSLEVNTLVTLDVQPVVSKDGGTSFQTMGGQNSNPRLNPGARYNVSAVTSAYVASGNPSTTLKFGLRVAGLSAAMVTSFTCHLQATLRNAIYAFEF
jgi:hypothetical protein